ncbi:mitogen-activated protein kinase kinase kinase [Tilletia horrida]|uniref:Mitogen-activated protein kinase kinase kinase n=1 Tax=Tilletia horrida TaxID=155126 RepID=A0AAN6GV45_9BASI|nr:mitogen-activated protein kinase kinase kinase [Tilletia horrida]KAK0551432.1 mitogen-activated protein kinase kinase kinase [Tilletia horrida]KAK0566401.1 mitogen-activated protein kinase kinase kinase [Tilletia horrida]
MANSDPRVTSSSTSPSATSPLAPTSHRRNSGTPFSPVSVSSAGQASSPTVASSSSPGSTPVSAGAGPQSPHAPSHKHSIFSTDSALSSITASTSSGSNHNNTTTTSQDNFSPSASTPASSSSYSPSAAAAGHPNPITNNSNSSTNDLREWYRRERTSSGVGTGSSSNLSTVQIITPSPSGLSGNPIKRKDRESRTSESKPRRPSSVFDLAGSMLDRFKGRISSSNSAHSRGESLANAPSSSKPGLPALSIASVDPFAKQEDISPGGPDSPSVAGSGSNASVHSLRQDRLTEPEALEVLHSPISPHPSSRMFSSSSNNSHYDSAQEYERDRLSVSSQGGPSSSSRGTVGMRRTSSALDRVYIQVTDDNERFAVVDVSGLSSAKAIKELMFRKLRLVDDAHVDYDAFQVYRTEIGVEEGRRATQPYIDDDSLLALCLQFGDDKGSLKFLVKPVRPTSTASRSSSGTPASMVASPHQLPQPIWNERSSPGTQHPSHRSNAGSISSVNELSGSGLHRARAQVKRHGHSASTSTDEAGGLSPSSLGGSSALPYIQSSRHASHSESSPTSHQQQYQSVGTPPAQSTRMTPTRTGSDIQEGRSTSGRPEPISEDGRPINARSSSFSTQSANAQAAREAVLSNAPSRSHSATVASYGNASGSTPFPPQTPSPSREIGPLYEQPSTAMQSSQSHYSGASNSGQMQPPPLNRNTSQPTMSSGHPAWVPPGSASQPASSVTSPQMGPMPSHGYQGFSGLQSPQQQQQHHHQHHQQQLQQQHPPGLRPANGITIHSAKSMDDIRMRMPQMGPPGSVPPMPSPQSRPPPAQYPHNHPPAMGSDGRPINYPMVAVTRAGPNGNPVALAPFDGRMSHSPAPSPQMRATAWPAQGAGAGGGPGPGQPQYHPTDPRYRSPSVGAVNRVSHYDPRYPPPPLPAGYPVQRHPMGHHPHPPPGQPHGMMGPPQRPMSAVPMSQGYGRPPPLPPQGNYTTPPPPRPTMPRPPGPGQPPPQYANEFGSRMYAHDGRPAGNPGAVFPTRPHTYHDTPQQHAYRPGPGGHPAPSPIVVREDPFTSAAFPNSSLRQVTQFQVAPTNLQPGMTVQQSLQSRNQTPQTPGSFSSANTSYAQQQGRSGTPGSTSSSSSTGPAGTQGPSSMPSWPINDHEDPYHRADAVARLTHEAQQRQQQQQQSSLHQRAATNPAQSQRTPTSATSPSDPRGSPPPFYSARNGSGPTPALRVSNPSSSTPESPRAPLPPTHGAQASKEVIAAPERSSGSSFVSAASASSGSSHARVSSNGVADQIGRFSALDGEAEGSTSSAPTSARSSRSEAFSPTSQEGRDGMAWKAAEAGGADGAPATLSPRSPMEAQRYQGHNVPQGHVYAPPRISSRPSTAGTTGEISAGPDAEAGMTIRPDLLLGTVQSITSESTDEDEDTLRAEKWETLRSVLSPAEAAAAQSREHMFQERTNAQAGSSHNEAQSESSATTEMPPPLPDKVRTTTSPISPAIIRAQFQSQGGEEGTFASFGTFDDDDDDEAGTWAQPLDAISSASAPASAVPLVFDAKGATADEGTIQPIRASNIRPESPSTGTGTASPRPPKLRIQTVPAIVQPSTPRLDESRPLSTSPTSDDEGSDDGEDEITSSAASSSLGRTPSFAKKSNDWALRPPPEELYDNLDDFFSKHDLDRPVVDTTAIPCSPLVGSPKAEAALLTSPNANAGPSSPTPFPARSRHKRSIRIVAEDGKKVMERKQMRQRVAGSVVGVNGVGNGLARRASTKLWGSKVVEMTPGQEPTSAVSAASTEPEVSGEASQKVVFKWVKGDLIGKGTYGRVYLALNVTTGEMIAVKQVELPRTDSERDNVRQKSVVNALKAEIQTLKDLDHPHIVSYLGFEETKTHLSIFLEYVPGGSVGSCIRKYGKFEEPVVSFFLHQILEGLAYLHDKGILHRDLKADNILVDWDGICKISDFGTVRKTDDIYNNQEMSLQGSIFWMAPEVVNMTGGGYSAKVDIWSLGCVVLEMLAGRRPWSEQEAVQAMLKIGSKKQTPPIPNDVKLSIQAQHFLDHAFEIDPTTRPTALKLLTHVFCYVPPEFHFEQSSLHAAMSRARRLT